MIFDLDVTMSSVGLASYPGRYGEYTITSFLGNFGACANIRYQAAWVRGYCWSSLIMWISAVFLVLSLILLQVLDLNYIQIFVLIFLSTLGIGSSGFQANIIQFGID